GNFAWLNTLTILLAFSAVSDRAVQAILPVGDFTPQYQTEPVWFTVLVLAVSALLVYLSYWPLKNLFAKRQLMNASFNNWHLANAYGAFGSITRQRYEVVVEGSADG